jgi:hypothetical protein
MSGKGEGGGGQKSANVVSLLPTLLFKLLIYNDVTGVTGL